MEPHKLVLNARPGFGRLITVQCHHQVESRMPLRQFTTQDVHHRRCRTDQSHPPAMCSGVAQQGPGQLDSSGFDHLHPLTGQGPDHSGTIGNHQFGRRNGFPKL